MAHKPSLWDRIVGFVTATPAAEVARKRERKHPSTPTSKPPTQPAPKPTPIPTDKDIERFVPSEQVSDFNVRTASMQELEWEIMNHNEPLEVRRAAAERWAAIAPRPMKPHLPFLQGVGHENFWMAFRDAYYEQEIF